MKLRVIIISSIILWFQCDILALAYTHAVQECLIIVTMSYFVSISQTSSISCRFVLPSSFHCLHKRISRKAGKNITSHRKICLFLFFFHLIPQRLSQSQMKVNYQKYEMEMLLALFRGINQGLWSHLECSGQNTTIFSCQSIFEDSLEEIICISWLDLRQSVESGLLA